MPPKNSRSFRSFSFGFRTPVSPGPPSPTLSEVTNASAFNFGPSGPSKIITRTDLKTNLQTYNDVMNASAEYRTALLAMSKATATFADAMERCSGLKGPSYEAGSRLQAAAGVHHLIGNLWHVLAETLDKKFERPLRQHLDTYKTIVHERSTSYEHRLHEKSRIIRQTEMRNLNRKERNLQSFRETLAVLQRQVDELDELKAAHYQEILEHEDEVWDVVQNKVCIVVRSTMDVFDRFTAKASDPIIEPMLQSVPDPFDAYGPPQSENQIFSILAPLSIMTQPTPSSSTPSPPTGTPEQDNSESLPSSMGSKKVASWLPTSTSVSNGSIVFPTEASAWTDTHYSTSPPSTPPRSVSPPHTGYLSRKQSVPSNRKAETKLRSVLSVIDEGRSSRHEGSANASGNDNGDLIPNDNTTSSPTLKTQNLNGTTPPSLSQHPAPETPSGEPEPGHLPHTWSFTYGQSPYEYGSNSSTPRNSMLFTSIATNVPPEPPSNIGTSVNDRRDSDDQLPTHINI